MKWQDAILVILFLFSLGIGFWYFFGDSPTLEQALLVFILTVVLANIVESRETKTRLYFLVKKLSG